MTNEKNIFSSLQSELQEKWEARTKQLFTQAKKRNWIVILIAFIIIGGIQIYRYSQGATTPVIGVVATFIWTIMTRWIVVYFILQRMQSVKKMVFTTLQKELRPTITSWANLKLHPLMVQEIMNYFIDNDHYTFEKGDLHGVSIKDQLVEEFPWDNILSKASFSDMDVFNLNPPAYPRLSTSFAYVFDHPFKISNATGECTVWISQIDIVGTNSAYGWNMFVSYREKRGKHISDGEFEVNLEEG